MKITELTSKELGDYAEHLKMPRYLHKQIEEQFYTRVMWVKDKRSVCSHCGAIDIVETFKNGDTKVCYKCQSQAKLYALRKNTNFHNYDQTSYARIIRRVNDVIIQTTYQYQITPTNKGEVFGYQSIEHLFLQGKDFQAVSWGCDGWTEKGYMFNWVPRRYSYQSWNMNTKHAHQELSKLMTPNLKYCQFDKFYENNQVDSPVDVLRILAKYPMLEMVWKTGMTKVYSDFVRDVKYKRETIRALKKYKKVLIVANPDMREISGALYLSEEDGIPFDIALPYSKKVPYHNHVILREYTSIKPILEMVKYVVKNDAYHHYFDYLNLMKQIGTPVDEKTIFPKDIVKAHDDATNKLNTIKYEKQNGAYAKVYQKLVSLNYASGPLRIIVPDKLQHIVMEGKELKHCVGSYVDRVQKGETTILFIRHSDNPLQPYYTMEYKGGAIIQVRGKENIAPTQEVLEFTQEWLRQTKKKKRQPAYQLQAINA